MSSVVGTIRNSILRLTFPRRCHCCSNEVKDAALGVACQDCWEKTTIFDSTELGCPKCGRISEGKASGFACGNCSGHFYDLARSLSLYEKASACSILHLKRVPVVPAVLTKRLELFGESLDIDRTDVIIPVPLSPQRKSDRGFNQAEVIAASVGSIFGKPVDTLSLVRKKHSPMHRAAMDKKAREASVENAFAVVRPKLIADRQILLIDDIFTSGATASNCAKALKKQGARSVNVLTLARTQLA